MIDRDKNANEISLNPSTLKLEPKGVRVLRNQ
jgi:hypothetical protein